MCDDLKSEMAALAKKNVKCSEIQEAQWGFSTKMRLPLEAMSTNRSIARL
jgi:hypothetical protein